MASEAFNPEACADIQALDRVVACGEECRDGYEFIAASDYDAASVGVFKKDSGVCGMPSGYSTVFKNIDFGDKGADSVTVEGEILGSQCILVEIYNEENGKKIAETVFGETSEKNRQFKYSGRPALGPLKLKYLQTALCLRAFASVKLLWLI